MHPTAPESSIRSNLRRVYRWFLHLPERSLHKARHRTALDRLCRRPLPQVVLMICQGNICRSPYAAQALLRELPVQPQRATRVESAGLSKPGRACPPEAREAATQRLVELGSHVSRLVTESMLNENTLVVVMEPAQASTIKERFPGRRPQILVLGDLDPEPISQRHIQDPVEQPLRVFEETYDRIDRCVLTLARALETSENSIRRSAV